MATTVPGPVERHDNDWTSAETAAGATSALWRGVRGRCPRCGHGRLFCAFLKVDDHCSVCSLDFTGHRADDLPAHLVIVIVGHVLVPVILWVQGRLCTVASVSAWHLPSDCGLGLDSSLRPVKGAVVALQWSFRMHGFGAHPSDESQA